jgi:tetratricopeptide (TPR) repeat protein
VSPKNKGKFGKGKSEVELDDQFLTTTQRLGETLKPYAARIAVAAGIIAIVVISVTTYRWWDHRKEAQATEWYAEAADILRRGLDSDPPPMELDPSLPPPVTYATAEARSQAAMVALERLQSRYGSTRVAQEARLLEASLLLELGDPDAALPLYEEYARKGKVAELRIVAREGIGYAYEAKAAAAEDATARQAALEQALAAFSSIPEGPAHGSALYHRGRVLALLNRAQEAREAFEQALEAAPAGAPTDHIQYRLAQLGAPATP